MLETDERIIRLTAATPLPCGVVRKGAFCGRDAYAGWAHPAGFQTGPRQWLLLPICPNCLKDPAQVFTEKRPQ